MWSSSLKTKHVSIDDHSQALELVDTNNMKNVFDHLDLYDTCDVIPMVEAIGKMVCIL